MPTYEIRDGITMHVSPLTNGKGTARFDITAEADELVRIEVANLNITPTQCVFLLGQQWLDENTTEPVNLVNLD